MAMLNHQMVTLIIFLGADANRSDRSKRSCQRTRCVTQEASKGRKLTHDGYFVGDNYYLSKRNLV